MTNKTTARAEGEVKFAVDMSRGFVSWLTSQNASIALTTYQVGKIIFIGVDNADGFWTYNRNIGRCLGLAVAPPDARGRSTGFWVSSDYQLFHFRDMLEDGGVAAKGADAFFAPRTSYFTGDLDVHDVALDGDDAPVFVATQFNCLARLDGARSFRPVWKPRFISRLAAEDRCHLNGLAMRDGKPAFVTAVSQSDTFDGWRDGRGGAGVVIDVESHAIVCEGLSMPHSPRWHEGRLWLHDSGRGQFGYVEDGRFRPIAFCPGYLRGLSFLGDVAVVGLSLPRDNKTFTGLDLDRELEARRMQPRCGIYFIDTRSGDIVHSLRISGVVNEIYDVSVLHGIRQPSALGPTSPELRRMISVDPAAAEAL
jgi:uncharacterized protein (TIGR03032 family)